MLDDLLAGLFGELAFGRLNNSQRAQLILRIFFGMLGSTLAAFGCWHFSGSGIETANRAMQWSTVGLFFFIGCFSLFNVALGRKWTWPGKLVIVSFVSMLLSRILLGR